MYTSSPSKTKNSDLKPSTFDAVSLLSNLRSGAISNAHFGSSGDAAAGSKTDQATNAMLQIENQQLKQVYTIYAYKAGLMYYDIFCRELRTWKASDVC